MKPMFGTMLLIALLALLAAVACQEDEEGPPRALTEQEVQLIRASNAFGLPLFNEVIAQGDGGNVFISPFSVSFALGMTHNGARGETETAMRETLGFGNLSREQINEGYRGILDIITGIDDLITLEIADAIWYRESYSIYDEFVDTCETYFDAEVAALDFTSAGCVDIVNDWVSDHTNGLIDEMLEDPPGGQVVVLLMNAVYFKGDWSQKFDEGDTQAADFHVSADVTVQAQMMELKERIQVQRADDFTAVSLPYGDGYFALTALLPAEEGSVDEFAAGLTPERWGDILDGFHTAHETLRLPKFELRWELENLRDVLAAMGMGVAFTNEADFSAMGPGSLSISNVKHKTYVRVDEEGTEAAAATSVEMDAGASSVEPEPIIFDRPFIYAIHDHHTGGILFIGKLVNPTAD